MAQVDNRKDLDTNKAQKQQAAVTSANKLKWPPFLELRPAIYKCAS